jgi:hypothetical protein
MNTKDIDIIRRRVNGSTLEQIGAIHKLSRQRVDQILEKYGVFIKLISFKPEGIEKQYLVTKARYKNPLICKIHKVLKRISNSSKRGLIFYCSKCTKKYYQNNPEKVRAYYRDYYKNNCERLAAYSTVQKYLKRLNIPISALRSYHA